MSKVKCESSDQMHSLCCVRPKWQNTKSTESGKTFNFKDGLRILQASAHQHDSAEAYTHHAPPWKLGRTKSHS